MAIVTYPRGDDGTLLLYDALWLDESTFAQLDALGPAKTIFVPRCLHDFDGERLGSRYPKAHLCGSRGTVRKLRWPGLVEFEPIPGVVRSDLFYRARHPEGGESLVTAERSRNPVSGPSSSRRLP